MGIPMGSAGTAGMIASFVKVAVVIFRAAGLLVMAPEVAVMEQAPVLFPLKRPLPVRVATPDGVQEVIAQVVEA
jgi:hypothetical protein